MDELEKDQTAEDQVDAVDNDSDQDPDNSTVSDDSDSGSGIDGLTGWSKRQARSDMELANLRKRVDALPDQLAQQMSQQLEKALSRLQNQHSESEDAFEPVTKADLRKAMSQNASPDLADQIKQVFEPYQKTIESLEADRSEQAWVKQFDSRVSDEHMKGRGGEVLAAARRAIDSEYGDLVDSMSQEVYDRISAKAVKEAYSRIEGRVRKSLEGSSKETPKRSTEGTKILKTGAVTSTPPAKSDGVPRTRDGIPIMFVAD